MNVSAHARRSTARLFAVYAVVTLIPIVVLGFILAAHFRHEAQQGGIHEARAEAQVIAQTAIEPLLDATPLAGGLSRADLAHMRRLVHQVVNRHGDGALRLRLRNDEGRVVFSDDGTGLHGPPDDEALDAAHGKTVVRLTHLNSDTNPAHPGPRAVEIYLPLRAGSPTRNLGVLELYLSYAAINSDVAQQLSTMYRDLIIGLGALYLALFAISASVTQRLRRESALNARLAQYDTLTGLPNRSRFEQQAMAALDTARRRGVAVTVAVLELDRFKEINDTLGHRNGDVVLNEIGRRLIAAAGSDVLVARLGGDEFGLALASTSDPEPYLAEIRRLVERDLVVGGLTLSIQSSVGYALAPADADDVGTLMRRADVAMYIAKTEHIGISRYDPDRDQYDAATLGLVAELRQAIDADQLVLHYQPQRNLATGRTEAIEALVRWQHPLRGLLPPDTFLPLAEQTDLIDQLTRWVLRRALTDLRRLDQAGAGTELTVAVNVSARGIERGELADEVIGVLRELDVDPRRLVIEVTETTILADPPRAAIELRRLTASGVKISLDDFGQGQTSLGHLSALPLAELKVDRGFVTDMLEHPAHAAIVHSIVDLGHNLGLRVVAEGVETDDVLRHLAERECDLAQGYLMSRPVAFEDLAQWLAAERVPRRGLRVTA
jgi:diguanylate cyclase (GGDEF)-like protein